MCKTERHFQNVMEHGSVSEEWSPTPCVDLAFRLITSAAILQNNTANVPERHVMHVKPMTQ
jgi:hypothetical protein